MLEHVKLSQTSKFLSHTFPLSLASSHHTLLISGPQNKDNVILHCFEIFTSHVGLTGREKAENQI